MMQRWKKALLALLILALINWVGFRIFWQFTFRSVDSMTAAVVYASAAIPAGIYWLCGRDPRENPGGGKAPVQPENGSGPHGDQDAAEPKA